MKRYGKCILALLSGLITLMVLYPTLQNGWTSWDDKIYILDNPLVKSLTTESIYAIFTTWEYNGAYTPLPMLSWAVNYHFTGTEAFPFHLTNLILHLINTLLCFVFIRLLTQNTTVAFVVGVLFGIHPMHLEPIAWITGRKDLFLGFFSLSSLVAWTMLESAARKRMLLYALTLVLTICALFSKGTAVVLPVWFLMISVLKYKKQLTKSFIKLAPFWIFAIGFGLIAIVSQQDSGAMKSVAEVDFLKSFVFAVVSLGTYCIKLLIPYHIGAAHNYPEVINFFTSAGLVSVAILFCLVVVYLLQKSSERMLLFSVLFFLVGTLPILQFLPVGYALTADRYVYIPYVGGFLALGLGLSKITQTNVVVKKLVWVGFTMYVLILGFSSWSAAGIWQSDLTLWNNEIAFHGYAPRAYVNRGQYYEKQEQFELAEQDYLIAVQQDPKLKEGHHKLGILLQSQKKYREAEHNFKLVLEIDSAYAPAWLNMALNEYYLGNVKSSFQCLGQAEINDPKNLLVYLNRGVIHQELGKVEFALNDYSKAIEVSPFNVRGYRFRGVLNFELGRLDLAISDFQRWKELNGKDPMVYRWLARYHSRMKDSQQFLENASMADRLGGAFPAQEFSQLLQQAE